MPGGMTVRIGANILDLQAGMAKAKAEAAKFALEIKRLNQTISQQAAVQYHFANTQKSLVTSTTSAKSFGMSVKELNEIQKKTFSGIGISLADLSKKMRVVGQSISVFVGLPLAGIGTAAVLASQKGRKAFDEMRDGVKGAFSDLGTTLVKDLDLQSVFSSIASTIKSLVDTFRGLPEPIRKAAEYAGLFAIALGPTLIIVSQLLKMVTVLKPLLAVIGGLAGAGAGGGALALGVAGAGLTAGYLLNKAIMPQAGPQAGTVENIDLLGMALARTAEIAGRANLYPKTFPSATRSIMNQGYSAGLEVVGEDLGAEIPNYPGMLRKLVGSGLSEEQLITAGGNIRRELETIFGDLPMLARQSGDATAREYLERLERSLTKAEVDLESITKSTFGKPIFHKMAEDADRDLAMVDQSIDTTRGTYEDFAAVAEDRVKILTSTWTRMADKAKELREKGLEPNTEELDKMVDRITAARIESDRMKEALMDVDLRREIAAMVRRSEMEGGGVDLVAGAREALMQKYDTQRNLPQYLGMSEEQVGNLPDFKAMRTDIEGLSTPWMRFLGLMQQAPPIAAQIATSLKSMVDTFIQGIGDAIGRAIVYGESLSEAMMNVLKQIAASVISMLVQIGINWVISKVISAAVMMTELVVGMKTYAALTYAAAFASTAAIPIVGIAAAPAAAAGAVAAMLAGAGGAAAAGAGFGAGTGAAFGAEGGIFSGNRPFFLAEVGKPEIALTQENVDRFFGGRMGGGLNLTVPVQIDGREVGRAAMRYGADELRRRGI